MDLFPEFSRNSIDSKLPKSELLRFAFLSIFKKWRFYEFESIGKIYSPAPWTDGDAS